MSRPVATPSQRIRCGGRLPLRMAGVLLLFVIDQAWLANSRMYLYIYADLTMAVGCGVLAVSVGCWLGGWRLMDGSAGSLGNDPPPPLQFTIRTLLVLTTLAAMATLAATSVYRRVESSGSFSTLLRSSVVATGYTLAFLLTAGCVLRHGRWTMRVAVASVTVPALGALTYFLLRATSSIAAGAQWFVIASALLALSLLPVRLLGYRMARVRPRNQWPADSGRPDRGA